MTVSAIYSSGRIAPPARVIKVRLDNHLQQRTGRNAQQSISSCLSLKEKLSYIIGTPIKPGDPLSPELLAGLSLARAAPAETSQEGQDTVGVVDGHATSFTRNLSGDQKEAVETSSLWAQFVANARYDRVTQLEDWFKEYNLNIAGWLGQGSGFHRLNGAGENGSGDKVVAILMRREGYSETEIELFRRTAETLKDTTAGQEAYIIYRRNTWKLDEAAFQVGICQLDGDDVVRRISAHSYNTSGFDA
ncbi:hypothetical protein PISMIDRAFT_158082 [Pisolithus microcarpus 441]|uniref:Uncharacterized protein n=1 Tax=Pisolithus microcarpus 441 TaxID=765257 RepID=A0A0C9Z9R8_9AGAM|nr:hypothetical protein PISMIDRAFT_158082 [Pisolithus microcarpus 441]